MFCFLVFLCLEINLLITTPSSLFSQEKNEQNEMDILEENIILREEVGHLTERLQKLNENAVVSNYSLF